MGNYENPEDGETYVSKGLPAFGDSNRKVRIASKVIESQESYAFARVRDELLLRRREGSKTYITAKFFEDDRQIFVLSIQGYSSASEKPHNASFSFVGEEIDKLLEFIRNIQSIRLKNRGTINISDEQLRSLIVSDTQASILVEGHEDLFAEVLRHSITKKDIVAVGYRKKQLDIFGRLLSDPDYFESEEKKRKCQGEALWQKFFEQNPWIFGYGLNYIYLSTLDNKKLEQVVQGYSASAHGKRVDGLMKTNGMISSLCFVEIKTHRTELLKRSPYRTGCWAPSTELAAAVSQVQGTVAAATDTIKEKLPVTDSLGNPTGEEAFNYQPKSYLIAGSLSAFVAEHGVNQEQYRSFELFRRNTLSPEIITFDELYERAKFIVHLNEK